MTDGNFPTSSRPSFGKLEKQFKEFRHRLEELGSLRKRIWVVVKYLSESLEMIQHRPYTYKVDGCSFGIVLWELLTGMLPFQKITDVQASFVVVNKGVRPAIPNDCLPVLSEIMTCCWDANPDNRLPFSLMVRMLEVAETEIMTTVRKARFRCCTSQPMTTD